GLGFDTLILADAGAQGKSTGSGETILYGEIDGFNGNYIGFNIPSGDGFEKKETLMKNNILDLERNKEKAELKRLFYVALTRVKNNLIVSASVNNELKRSKGTFVEYLGEYFAELINYVSTEMENQSVELRGIPFY